MNSDKNFDRSTLEFALAELGKRAFAADHTVEIVIYGGSALLLTLNRQVNTGDVDAVFEGSKQFIRTPAFAMKCRAMRIGGVEANSDILTA